MGAYVHFDEAAVAAAVDRANAQHAADLDKPGSAGAQARMIDAVLKPMMLALAQEANRGTAGEDILSGMAAVLANLSKAFVLSCVEEDASPDEIGRILNLLVGRYGFVLGCVMPDRAGVLVKPMPGGRA